MAETKTKPTALSAEAHIDAIADETRRADCHALIEIMRKATGAPATMWGPTIVGFGSYHYRYESGHEGDACLVGFASRKSDLAIYLMAGFDERDALLARLGKHKVGKACLYVKRLADVDRAVLERLVALSVAELRRRYP